MKSLLLAALLFSFNSFASTTINTDTIDIDGTYDSSYSDSYSTANADQIKKLRRKLELQNEIMMKKKIESMRLQQELELMKKMNQAFNQAMDRMNQIQ